MSKLDRTRNTFRNLHRIMSNLKRATKENARVEENDDIICYYIEHGMSNDGFDPDGSYLDEMGDPVADGWYYSPILKANSRFGPYGTKDEAITAFEFAEFSAALGLPPLGPIPSYPDTLTEEEWKTAFGAWLDEACRRWDLIRGWGGSS
jgi:hypothetical protein